MFKKLGGVMKSKFFCLIAALTMGFAMPAYAVEACNDEMGHVGEKKTVQGKEAEHLRGYIGSTGFDYEVWFAEGSGSMTYWDNGTFSAEWNGTDDFLARVGLKYSEAKTFDKFGDFSADFKFIKSGSANYSNIGVYGRTENPAVEYYIVDDWFSAPSEDFLGEKVGEFVVDGDTYDIWKIRRNTQPTIQGDMSFWQVVSVRRNARQCGHIDITAHFKKWEELGIKLGVMNEVKMLAEAGGKASGKIDFTYFSVNESAASSPEQLSVILETAKPLFKSGITQVFDIQGRYLGTVELKSGVSLDEVVSVKFQQPGKYLLKQNGNSKIVTVK